MTATECHKPILTFLSSSFLSFHYLAGDFSVAVTDCFFSCCYWVTSKSLWRVFKGASTVLLPLFLPFLWTSNLLHLWHQCMPKLNCGIYSELKRGFTSFSFAARPFFLPTMTEAPSVANPINLTIERVRACNWHWIVWNIAVALQSHGFLTGC